MKENLFLSAVGYLDIYIFVSKKATFNDYWKARIQKLLDCMLYYTLLDKFN